MTDSQDWFADHIGPVEIIALTLPSSDDTTAWTTLLAAVEAHSIRVLDLEFVRRNGADEAEFLALEDLVNPPAILGEFEGADSGLVADEDAAALLSELADGEIAAVLLVEHLGVLPALRAFETSGSRLLLDGTLDLDEVDEALADSDSDD
jgi:hypothetical protein